MTTHSVADRSGFVHELLLPPRPPRWLSWSSHSPGMVWQPRNRRCSPSGPRSPQLSATPWSQHRTSRSCPSGQPGRPASDLRATNALLAGYMATAPSAHPQPGTDGARIALARMAPPRSGGQPRPGPPRRGPYASTTGTRSPPTRLTTSRHPPAAVVGGPAIAPTTATRTQSSSSASTATPHRPGGAHGLGGGTDRSVPGCRLCGRHRAHAAHRTLRQ